MDLRRLRSSGPRTVMKKSYAIARYVLERPMRRNAVGSFADHDRKLNLVIGPALRMTDHYRFGWPYHRTGSLEEETHTFNFGNLIAVVNFEVFTRLLEVPPVVNRCAYDLAWVSDWGSEPTSPIGIPG